MLSGCCCAPPEVNAPLAPVVDQAPAVAEQPEALPPRAAAAAAGAAPPKAAAAASGPSTFTVPLRRASADHAMGVRLEAFEPSKHIFITSVAEDQSTIIGKYNTTAAEDRRICAGDYIVAVGKATDLNAMRTLMEASAFDITIRRSHFAEVTVPKRGMPLGLGIKYDPAGTSLTIKSVDGGGAAAAAGVDIAAGDRIVGVNGVSGRAEAMLAQLKESDTPKLQISRCADDA